MRRELAEGGEVPFRRTQVGGSMPGVPVVTTAQRSGRSRRTGANAMCLVFSLYLSVPLCAPQSARRCAVRAVRDRAGTAGGFPPCLPYSTATQVNREPYCPPFQIPDIACGDGYRETAGPGIYPIRAASSLGVIGVEWEICFKGFIGGDHELDRIGDKRESIGGIIQEVAVDGIEVLPRECDVDGFDAHVQPVAPERFGADPPGRQRPQRTDPDIIPSRVNPLSNFLSDR